MRPGPVNGVGLIPLEIGGRRLKDQLVARLYMIRHGRPAAVWGGHDDDPGLDSAGLAQAEAAARALLALPESVRPTRVASSPMKRCRETAAPSAAALGVEVEVVADIGEIPTPKALSAAERGPWLRGALQGLWPDVRGDLDTRSGAAASTRRSRRGPAMPSLATSSPSTPWSR